MTPHVFLTLQDFVLPPPAGALMSLLMVSGIAYLGWRLARRLRGDAAEGLDVAAGFVVAAAALAAVVHGLALAQLSTVAHLWPLGWGLAGAGLFALVRHRRRIVDAVRGEAAALRSEPAPAVERAAAWLVAAILVGLAASALGPPTDADSFDYHLGVPLDWLRHGGAFPRDDWYVSRLVGITESLNMLGLGSGTDGLGAALQFGGLIVAAVALRALAATPRDRLLAWLLVAACPVMAFLVPNQKPQLLPAGATTVALVLAVRRFSDFRAGDALLAIGCAAFAAASKLSFLLSVGFVVLVCLAAARRSGRLTATLAIGAAVFAVVLLPLLGRNLAFYGDPMSPFLERFRAHPDPAVAALAAYLRVASGEPTAGNLLRLPLKVLATTHPGELTTVLGLGALAFVPALRAPGQPRWLLLVAATCAGAMVVLGQIAPRFFLEPYLWAGGALVAAPASRGKVLLVRGLALQAVLVAGLAAFGAATLFPGALTASAREATMSRAAPGYAEARWEDRVLPPDAVMVGAGRFHAASPRPFAVLDSVLVETPAAADERLARVLAPRHVNTLVLDDGSPDALARLARRCGRRIAGPQRFTLGTRNPFNRQPYGVTLYRLAGCWE